MKDVLHSSEHAGRILNIAFDSMFLLDKNGICIDAIITNNILSLPEEETLRGKNLFETLPPATSHRIYPEFKKVATLHVKSTHNYELIQNGKVRHFACIMFPYEEMVLCQCHDVTEDEELYRQKEAEKCDREQEESVATEERIPGCSEIKRQYNNINMLTRAFYNAPENIFAANEDGMMIFANRSFRQHHDITSQENITERKIYDISSHIWNREKWEDIVKSVKRKEKIDVFIISSPLPSHPEILAMEGNAFCIADNKGQCCIWIFSRDITQRIRSEQEVQRFNQVLNKTIENLPASIVVKDIQNDFKYLYRNKESYNRELNQLNPIGKSDFDFHPYKIAKEKRQQDIEVATTGKEQHWVEEDRDQAGNLIYIDKRKLKIDNGDFDPILLSIEWDITEMERMKRELIKAKEKAETSDRLKSAFLANMSHEIRTPLNAIVGFSRIIAESSDAEERKNYYDIIESNNERLLQLINEILDLSKIEAGMTEFNITPVRLHPLCQEIYNAHRLRCPEGVELIYEPSDEELIAKGDKNHIFQVVSNLIGNALKFTKEGSISYGYKREGNMISFHVSDTGSGISPEKMDKVFDRFVKANDFAQGSGLGLSISKTIIEQLGGHITVSSQIGKGTTFTFTLPIEEETVTVQHPQPVNKSKETLTTESNRPHSENNTNRKKILIAEDTDSSFSLLETLLKKEYHIERAKDGMEAVSLFEDIQPDLILMDLKMPNLGGIDAIKIIRELSPKTPIFAITAYAFERDRLQAMESGCNEFFAKPYLFEKLKETIKKYLYPEKEA